MNKSASSSVASSSQVFCLCNIRAREYICQKEGRYKGQTLYGCMKYPNGCKFFGVKKDEGSLAHLVEAEFKNISDSLNSMGGNLYRIEDCMIRVGQSIESLNYNISWMLRAILYVLIANIIVIFWCLYYKM